MKRLRYLNNCVNWPKDDVDEPGGLIAMIDEAQPINRMAFVRRVHRGDRKTLERSLGYENDSRVGLTMANDYHVSYHRSKLHGKPVVFFKQSAIEYVFHPL